jgi:ABC-type maltose transport system permease subunit
LPGRGPSSQPNGASGFWKWDPPALPLTAPVVLVALVFLGTDSAVAVVTAQLNELVGSKGEKWHILTAGAFITMLFPLTVFLALQRYFVRGLLAGSVKG